MGIIDKNRKDLYESLLAEGFFIDDDGNAELSLEEFAERMADEETAKVFYENLTDAGFFSEGEMTEEQFLCQLCRYHATQDKYPLTENQRGVYIDWDMHRDALQYNIPSVQRLDGVDACRLRDAVEAAITAHPYLKTRLVMADTSTSSEQAPDVYQQPHYDEPTKVDLIVLDESPKPGFFQDMIRPFDLFNDCLYRAAVYTVKDNGEVFLFLDIHHIVFDGESAVALMNDIRTAYEGETLKEETYTSFDNSLDEAELLKSERYAEAQTFFDNLLAGSDTTVYPLSSGTDKDSHCLTCTLDVDRKHIQEFCHKHGVTENNYMLTALLIALQRITRDEQVVITNVNNGRQRAEMQGIMGMFVKTIPVVFDTDVNKSFSETVQIQQKQNIDIQEHDYYPFTHMVQRNGLRAEIMYDYAEGMGNYASVDDPVCKVALNTVKCPVSLTCFAKTATSYMLYLEYDSALYSKADMQTLLTAMKNVALQAADGEKKVCQLSLVSPAEAERLVELSTGKTMDFDKSDTFPAMFIRQAEKTPDQTAVVDEQGAYSYRELNDLTNALAQKLVELRATATVPSGEAQGTCSPFVSIMLGYQKEFLVASIGIEKAGCAYVPLDYDYPNDRLLYMLQDSESSVLVTSHAIFDEKNANGEFSHYSGTVLYLDDFLTVNCQIENCQIVNLSSPDGIAYMIYTSGSTGKPKGVMIPHRAKANFVRFIAKAWGHTAKSRICCHSSFSFDASVEDLYPVLTVGGTLYTVPQAARKDLGLLHDFIIKNGITGGCYTTQLGQMLLQQYPDLPVDYLVVGGEKMTANVDCKCRLINTYGPTEFTVDATYYELEKGREYKNIPIGRPLHNLKALVVDRCGNLLPQGVAGELCMSGPQMAAGYWHREDLTEKVFTELRNLGTKEHRNLKVYHTGDLVRYNAEDQIEYLGRIDSQVKLRGFRIELGEIESLIAGYAGIQMESVQVKEIGGVQHLCAYYTADCEIDSDALKEYLAESLTDYMVPTAYMLLDTMPLTPNGKVNTKALPLPEIKAEEIVTPETELEQKLFDITAILLKHDQFGVTSNLISMGLTSLTAMRLSATINQELGINIPTKDILSKPTLRQMAQCQDVSVLKLHIHDKQEYYPITENQRVVYLDWEMNRDTTQYNIPVAWRMKNADAHRLVAAIKAVFAAHPYLKTRLVQRDGDIMQQRLDEAEVDIVVKAMDAEPTVEFLQQRVQPFDLLGGNLYHVEVYTYADKTYVLLDIHHIINDGLSVDNFMSDLMKAYNGEALKAETYTAYDHALDEQEMAASELFDEAEKHFDNLLDNHEVTVYPHSQEGTTDGTFALEYLDVEGTEIDAYCKKNGFTQGNYFLTAFLHLLHNVTREENIMITSINNGRSDVKMLDIMGMFVKTVPVVSDGFASDKPVLSPVEALSTGSKSSFKDNVKAIQEQFQATQSYDFYPFTRMVERHKVRAEIMYEYQVGVEGTDSSSDIEMLNVMLDTAKMPLMVSVNPADEAGKYRLVVRYNPSLYSQEDMQSLLRMLKTISAEGMMAKSMTDIPLISNEEQQEIINYSAGNPLAVDPTMTFVKAFVKCARENADRVAVNDYNGDHTYAELDKWSNALAHRLLAAGVEKDSFVALLLERAWTFPMSIIASHKAGAAYTPLDTDYPVDRLQYMLENSEAKVLVTTHAEIDAKRQEGLVLPDTVKEVIYMDDFLADSANVPCDSPIDLSEADDNAYMIYTSGSTGKPKGVVLHQAGLWNFIESIKSIYHHTAEDRIASHRAFSFVAHVEDTYAILTVGGSLHIMPSEIRKDLQLVYQFIVDHKCTGCGFTTSLAMMMLDNYDLPTRYITAGGEKLTGVVSTGHPQIINVYGPTECTDHTSVYLLETGREYKNIPVGKTLPNNWMLAVSPTGQLLPHGVAGELCYAGIGVGRGYWRMDDKTAEVFGDCPFIDKDSYGRKVRMYHVGDLVRWTSEGVMEYLGRIDNQVKVRGFRIELGEIESVVRQMEDIYIAAVKIIDLDGNKYISLYYTPIEGKTVSNDDVRKFVENSSLADYMRPDFYTLLDKMPRLPNGKVNRKALPMPEMKAEEIIAPETEMEKKLFDVTVRMLKHDRFGVTTNLISAGLTSLIAMRLSAILYNVEGIRLATKDIITKGNIRALALLCTTISDVAATHEKREYYPLTENQRGVYIDWEMNRESTQYNMPKLQSFTGITAEQLRDVLVKVVNAHPYIKTHLDNRDGDVVQLRLDDDETVVTITELAEEPTIDFFQSKTRPFDLFNDRLYRLDIFTYNNKVWLLRDFHHIIFDGASGFVFASDMEKALSGEALKAETYTAFDFAIDEQARLKSDEYGKAEKYFDELLAEVESTRYPLTPKSEMPKEKVVNTELNITVEGTAINAFCHNHAVTASNYFLTMFTQVLHRTTREENVLITTVNNGRSDSRMMDITGMFVKTLPVVSKKAGAISAAECVAAIQKQFQQTQALDFYPYTTMTQRNGIRSEIMFVFLGGLDAEMETAAYNDSVNLENDTAKMPLAIRVYEKNGGHFGIALEFDSSMYSETDMRRLLLAIKHFAENVAETDAQDIRKVSLVDDFTATDILSKSRGRDLPYNTKETFVDMVLGFAKTQPEHIAVVDAVSQITYKELADLSNIVAQKLISMGVTPNSFVGIMMPRRKEFMIGVLAIQRSGAAYVPMDNEYPTDRLLYMMENSEAPVLVTTRAIYEEKQSEGDFRIGNVLFLDEFLSPLTPKGGILDSISPVNGQTVNGQIVNLSTPDGLAYMIYTSGSTGLPKGVMLTHRSLRALLAWHITEIGHSPETRNAAHPSFSFDASLDDLICPLAGGGTVYILSEEIRKDMDGMMDYFRKNRITGLSMSSPLGMTLMNTYTDQPFDYIMMGGDKMLPMPKTKTRIINGYGPTEFTVCSSFHIVNQDKDVDIPIGHPVPNSYSAICDPEGNLLPMGVPGELCLAGVQMSNGYWKLEEKTNSAFTEARFPLESFSNGYKLTKVYHTGDLARYNANGELEFMGRIDNQVKLRGFRIEMGEVENRASQYADIDKVAAAVKTINGIQHLCLFFTTTSGAQADTDAMEKFMAETLTGYMVPDVFMQLDEMPLTPNGKVNRKGLPTPKLASNVEYVEPQPGAETIIADSFKQVLGLSDPVGALDSFYALGGDSIKAIRLVSMLRQSDIVLQVAQVLQLKTVRAMAEATAGVRTVVNIDQNAWSGEVKNSAIFDFFFNLHLPKPNVFLQSQLLETRGLDIEAMRKTLTCLVVHHDMLRARVREGHLAVAENPDYSFNEYDLRSLSGKEMEDAVTARCIEEKEAFDIENGTMLRAAVLHLADRDLLLLAIHHLVVDGVSWRILFEDLANCYNAYTEVMVPEMPKKTHSYREYADALMRYRESYSLEKEKDYWEDIQRGVRKLKTTKADDYTRTFGHSATTLDAETTDGLLHRSSEAYHTEINDLLLTALGRSYNKLTGESSLSLQLEGHGREDFGENILIDRTVGWFTSAYPVLLTGLGDDLRHDIRNTKESLHRIPNKGFGYAQLMGMDIEQQPLMGFNYLGEVDAEQNSEALFQMSELDSGYDIAPENTFGSSISVNCSVAKGQLSVRFTYDEAQWSEEVIKALADGMITELQALVSHCMQVSEPEVTATDLGSVTMTDEEFLRTQENATKHGIKLLRLYPLTPMQEGMLLEYVSNPGATSYLSKSAFSLNIVPTEEQMREAIRLTAAKHEVMRTSIIFKDVAMAQQAITDRQPDLHVYDMPDCTDEQMNSLLCEEINKGIDLQDESLYRFLLVKKSETECYIGMVTQHIITDGWSAGLVNKDFFTNLIMLCTGENPQEVSQPGRYESFVRHLYSLDKKKGLAYWKKRLEGYGQQAIIPSAGEVPVSERAKDTDITLFMEPAKAAALNALCQQEQVTLNSAIELAWGRTMQVYNNVEDVVFGKVVSGRDNADEDVSDLAGIFINTVPVRIQTDAKMTVREALHSVQDQAAETNRYDFCHLSEIQQQSELGSNLLQIILAFENFPGTDEKDDVPDGDIRIEATDFKEENFADFEVVVHVGEEGELAMRIAFNPARYRSEEVERVIRTFLAVAESMVSPSTGSGQAPIDRKMGDLQLVDETERKELLALGRGELLDFDRSMTLVDVFQKQAAKTPDATAIVFRDVRMTFAEVDALTDRLAVHLASLGSKPETAVGVMIDRSELMLIYPMAIMKAGAAYMPLDSHFPEERLSFMCEDAGVKLLLSDDGIVKEAMPHFSGTVFQRSDLAGIPEVTADQIAALPKAIKDNMFVILYTSGSTGKPKGCMLEHHNIVNFCQWYVKEFDVTAEDRAVAYANFGFDAHMMDMYPALSVGASVYIIPSDLRMDLMAMNRYIEDNGLTIAFMTTQIGYMFATTIENHSLRLLSVGGEKLQPLKKPRFRFYNGYGPTECTLYSTCYNINKDYDSSYIGRPLAGYQLMIVDKQMNLVPKGVPGELIVMGAGVGRGYLNRPDVNAEKFIKINGEKAYRTGDLVRWSPDDNIDFMGRIDNQVKLRGLRIELGEIEARASKYDGIREVCVDVKEIAGMQNLVCYYSVSEGATVTDDGLKAFLGETLTNFMVPEIYVTMDKLPLTPNGKVNRRALPVPQASAEAGEIVPPETEMEKKLFDIFAEMLKTEQFGVTTNLITVGMTSLSAMRISAMIVQRLGIDVKTKELLSNPTIRHLAQMAESGEVKKAASMRLGKPAAKPTGANPLQKRSDAPAGSNPLAKRALGSNPLAKRDPGSNPLQKRNPNNNPLNKRD